MTRLVQHLEGLALAGTGTLGPIVARIPGLIEDPASDAPAATLRVDRGEGPSGIRRLRLRSTETEVPLDFPILNPEVTSTGGGVHRIAERAFLLHAPAPRESYEALRKERPELVVLGNAHALWNEGEPFLATLRDLRAGVGPEPMVWAPRVALPHRIPFLVYVGVDLLDTTEGLLRSAHGEFLDATLGSSDRNAAAREGSCDCLSCASQPPGSLDVHTRTAYRRSIAETRAASAQHRLRELVESRLPLEPALAEMLRYADRLLAGPLDERTPVAASYTRAYVIAESHRRPEMRRFRDRLIARYRPPRSKSVLLLVPCSKGKPYRRSRSHRRFAAALEGLRAVERIHLVSISSPIGVVPRELEDVYPARNYDIPVTGEWTETEREFVTRGLRHLRRDGAYRSVIVHLDPVEYGFLRDLLPPGPEIRWTLEDGRTTSAEALRSLRDAAAAALSEVAPVPGGPLAVVREELQELASVQWGRSAAERLFAGTTRLAGRPWFQRLTDGRTDLATVREERGLFHLTVAGAQRIGPPYPLAVEIDPELPLTGDLFAPGVRSADVDIRVGDSVVLLRDGALAGVGEAALPGALMTGLGRGLAVRVRHRVHLRTDTSMMADESPTEGGPVV